ncbi:MAG: T9SS C-terminal target domain-containing protein [Calditrichaeota bacterium]|nr:MAG: T9SS C-terminal target domain-containing protein [Calditrichota bacterium]
MKQLLLISSFFVLATTSAFCQQTTEIYVSDAANFNVPPWKILKFDENGQNPEVFIDTNLAWPQDILFFEEEGEVLISNFSSNQITKFDANTGAYIGAFATGILGPTRMKIGADSLLYVLQWNGTGKVKRYQLDGTFVDDFTSVGVPQSIGIDWDSLGNLYVSTYYGGFVQKFDTSGNDLGIFISDTDLQGPTNIWFDTNGDLLVLDYDGTSVKRFDSNGNFLGDFLTGLDNCEGVDFLPNGNILIGNGGTSSVKMFDSSGNYISDFIPSGSGNLINPNAVVIRENPNVSIPQEKEPLVKSFSLSQNYPNPFNPTTTINYELEITNYEFGKLSIFNILGEKVKSFALSEKKGSVVWNGTNELGNQVASGIYVYKLQVGNFEESRKMLLLK